MRNKSQAVRHAKKVGEARNARRRKVESKKRGEAQAQVAFRRMGVSMSGKMASRLIGKVNKKKEAPKAEPKRKELKPYRIILLQGKVEKLQAGIRALDHTDPKREKLVKRLDEIKKKLGK